MVSERVCGAKQDFLVISCLFPELCAIAVVDIRGIAQDFALGASAPSICVILYIYCKKA